MDYKPPRAPFVPWKLPTGDYRDFSLRSYGKQPPYLRQIRSVMVCMIGFIVKDKKEETLEDEYMKGDVQVQEHPQLFDISRLDDFNSNFVGSMDQEVDHM